MTFLRRLVYGCWFGGHGDQLRERHGEAYVVVCARCGCVRDLIPAAEVFKGPCHQPRPVLGEPKTKTFRLATKPTAVAATSNLRSTVAIARRK